MEALREISRPVAAITVYERHQYAKAASHASADFTGGAGVAGSGSEPEKLGFDGDGGDDGASFLKTRYALAHSKLTMDITDGMGY